jgi:hypothetical protein
MINKFSNLQMKPKLRNVSAFCKDTLKNMVNIAVKYFKDSAQVIKSILGLISSNIGA